MTVQFTEYQRPDPDTEYEELPIIVGAGQPPTVDPKEPPYAPETVVCCTCTGALICTSEQSAGAYATYYLGGAAVYQYG